jgi:hypothetical protein
MAVVPEPSSNLHQATSSALAGLDRVRASIRTKEAKKNNFLHIIILLTREFR